MSQDDAKMLADISRDLPPIDLDEASARRIVHQARQSVGRGPSLRRFVEPVLVTLLLLTIASWTAIKLYEVLG